MCGRWRRSCEVNFFFAIISSCDTWKYLSLLEIGGGNVRRNKDAICIAILLGEFLGVDWFSISTRT